MQHFFEYSKEILDALQKQKPLLALESTLITHGFPKPLNHEIACTLENIARDENVTPATLAIINGKIKIGLSKQELKFLAEDNAVVKASTRDIPYIITKKLSAGLTVSATLFCASRAGIKIFATGGIGGVHRGDTLDISADLIEIARTPVAVVCAGAKAILDLTKTLEFLETHCVPIIGYQTNYLPAFYSASSQYKLPAEANNIAELAEMITAHFELENKCGVIIANPIPKQYEISNAIIEPFIQSALQKASNLNITGKQVTPFLLNELVEITQGRTLTANIELIKNNVVVGARLVKMMKELTSITNKEEQKN